MKKYSFVLFLIFFLILPLLGFAQFYNFDIYSVNQGLSHAQVNDLHQGSDGFMWIATKGGGLNRFDGNNFKTYTKDDGLRSNTINRVYEDSKGRLWVANSPGGVSTFRGDSLVNPFPNDSLSQYEVWRIKEFDGTLWFGTDEGGIFIKTAKGWNRLTKQDGLTSNSTWDFWKDDRGRIWIGTQEGISIFEDGNTTTTYTTADGLSGNKIYKITESPKGNQWIATNKGISIWDGENFRQINEINGVQLGYVFDISVASDGNIWIATETKGVFIYDGESYTRFTRENGLSSNYIHDILEDESGNMWIGTNENGVSLFKGKAFVFYNEAFGLPTNEVLSVYHDKKETLWMGTTEGIASINTNGGGEVKQYPLPGTYENKYIWEIEALANGNLLFLMPDNTVMEYDGNQFHNFSQKYNIGKPFIYDLFVDSDNVLWIGTDQGLLKIKDDQLTRLTTEDGLARNVVHYVEEAADGRLLIGTTRGLSIYGGEHFRNFRISDGLASNTINYITQDSKSNIWLGTSTGVSLLQEKKGGSNYDIKNFGKDSGMDLLKTHFIWFDKEGYLWQGTNGGLNRLDVPGYWEDGNMSLVDYSLSDRGLGTEFNFKAVTTDGENNAWFGSMEGALKLDISKLREEKQKPPKIYITNIERNAKAVDWKKHSDSLVYERGRLKYPSVIFPPGEHSYTFSFIGIDYSSPDNIQYQFKMAGFDNDWMPVTTANSATYTNLNPGDYTFKVRAMSRGKKQVVNIATYSFSVAYPFWQTYWFYALAVLALSCLVYGYIKIRFGMMEKKRLQKLVDEQTKDLTKALGEKEVLIKEIHHRVKNNLAVISGMIELQRGYADNEFVNRVLSESQRRIQSIAMIHEKLYQNERLAEINFDKYVRELVDIISYSFNFEDKEIEVNIEVDDFKLSVDQGIPCGLILNELVSNAYEHAFKGQKEGTIEIRIKEGDSGLVTLMVADNGIGLPKDFNLQQQETLGITLVETLSNQLDGELRLRDSQSGTRFVLTFEKEKAPLKIPT